MPRSRNPQSYTADYWALTLLHDDAMPHSITFPSRQQAERWRFSWYDFVEALRKKGHQSVNQAERLSLSVKDCTLTISLQGDPEGMKIVLASFGGKIPTMDAPPQQPQRQATPERIESLKDALDKEFGIKDDKA